MLTPTIAPEFDDSSISTLFDPDRMVPDTAAGFDREGWTRIRASGVLSAPFDRRCGGRGCSTAETMRELEALGAANRDAGLSFSAVTSMASTGVPLNSFARENVRNRYLGSICTGELIGAHAITEEDSGSDALSMATTAERDGEHFLLNGSKSFVTNAGIADLYTVYARTGSEPGPLALTAFLVPADTPGLRVTRTVSTMGLRGSPVGELELNWCRIPAENVLGRVGGGFLVLDHVMEREVLFSFVVNVGEMGHRLRRCIDRARSRQQYGRPIGTYQAVANRIVDMQIAVESARMWLYRAAATLDAGSSATHDISIAKLVTSQANTSTALDAMQIFGGRGYLTEFGIEQELRNAVAGSIYSGTNEIQYNRVAAMLGLR